MARGKSTAVLPPGCELSVELVPAQPVWGEPFRCIVKMEKAGATAKARSALLDLSLALQVWVERRDPEDSQGKQNGEGGGGGDALSKGVYIVDLSEGESSPPSSSIQTSAGTTLLQDGKAEFSVSFDSPERAEDCHFYFCATLAEDQIASRETRGGGGAAAAAAGSSSIKCCKQPFLLNRYKLVEAPPKPVDGTAEDLIFYKDEGGKQKHMTSEISLVDVLCDRAPPPVGSASLPLEATLLYENGNPPFNQSIFTVFSEDSCLTVSQKSPAIIRYRIDEVSKNHAGQRFMLRVGLPESADVNQWPVSPCFTHPVTVLSKRKNLAAQRREQAAAATAASRSLRGSSPQGRDFDSGGLGTQSQPKYRRRRGGERGDQLGSNADPPRASEVTTSSKSLKRSLPESIYASIPPPTVDAPPGMMDMIGEWVTNALNALSEVQWVTVGFEVGSGNEVDRSRPIRRCPSCNAQWDSSSLVAAGMSLPAHFPGCELAQLINSYIDNGHSSAYRLLGVYNAPLGPALKRARLEDEGGQGGGRRGGQHQHHQTIITTGNDSLHQPPPSGPLAPAMSFPFRPNQSAPAPPMGDLEHKMSVQFWLDRMESSISEERDGESSVYFALEGGLKSSVSGSSPEAPAGSELYWPTYNISKSLIGFYKEVMGDGMIVTSAEFIAETNPSKLGLTASKLDLENALHKALESSSSTVISLEDAGAIANIKKRLLLSNMYLRDIFGRLSNSDLDGVTGSGTFITRQISIQSSGADAADLEAIINSADHLNGGSSGPPRDSQVQDARALAPGLALLTRASSSRSS